MIQIKSLSVDIRDANATRADADNAVNEVLSELQMSGDSGELVRNKVRIIDVKEVNKDINNSVVLITYDDPTFDVGTETKV